MRRSQSPVEFLGLVTGAATVIGKGKALVTDARLSFHPLAELSHLDRVEVRRKSGGRDQLPVTSVGVSCARERERCFITFYVAADCDLSDLAVGDEIWIDREQAKESGY